MTEPVAYVYLLRCRDGSLYCGWTTDLDARLEAHATGKGGRYTRSRLPVALAAAWRTPDRTTARSLEGRIKRRTKPTRSGWSPARRSTTPSGSLDLEAQVLLVAVGVDEHRLDGQPRPAPLELLARLLVELQRDPARLAGGQRERLGLRVGAQRERPRAGARGRALRPRS